jgi:hypothetical protein
VRCQVLLGFVASFEPKLTPKTLLPPHHMHRRMARFDAQPLPPVLNSAYHGFRCVVSKVLLGDWNSDVEDWSADGADRANGAWVGTVRGVPWYTISFRTPGNSTVARSHYPPC